MSVWDLRPSRARSRATLGALFASALLLGSAVYVRAGDQAKTAAQMHPVEFAMRAFAAPIRDRTVIRNGPAQLDVWLFAGVKFETFAERVRSAISARRKLVGDVTIDRWTYFEPTRSYWLDIGGPHPGRVWMSRHADATLIIIPKVGDTASARPWTPPYRPLPIDLPHGPIR